MSSKHFILRLVTFAWAAITLVHFTIWSLVCIIGGDLDSPWWLWIAIPPGAVLGGLWYVSREGSWPR